MRPSLILSGPLALAAAAAAEGTQPLWVALAFAAVAAALAAPAARAAFRPRPVRVAAPESLPDSYLESPIVSLTR